VSDDLLDALLREAQREQALTPEELTAFGAALRARAERILAERVRPIEERAAAFEKESAWRAETIAGLEAAQAAAEKEIAHLRGEIARRDEEIARERVHHAAELDRRSGLEQAASRAHDQLLAHHRDLLGRVAAELERLGARLPWGYRHVRAQLAAWVSVLRREVG
jgi:hypothetical protein